tara:strand:+ start:863 stop:1249 length:387 start_codon:yes stop_codon:yes gene_type:complete
MGKKAAHSGESPKDRSVNMMDKFITRNERRIKHHDRLPARRKSPDVPFHMWPLKDQIDHVENRTDEDRFTENYPAYSYWIDAVQKKSKVHPRTFTDWTLKLKTDLHEMYNKKTAVRDTVEFLRKRGIY